MLSLTLTSSIVSRSPPISFQVIGRVNGSTISAATVSSYSLNYKVGGKNYKLMLFLF